MTIHPLPQFLRPTVLWVSLVLSLALLATSARADILAVENGTPDVLRFSGAAGTPSTFTTSNLDSPLGISADGSGNVYVVDQGASSSSPFSNSVAKYSPTGGALGFYVTPATPPGNTLNASIDIAFDMSGNGYVTSSASPNPPYGYIAAYNSAGAFTSSFGAGSANVPSGIGRDPVNGLLYVVNSASTGPNANSLLIFNLVNTAVAPTIITPTGAAALDGGQQVAFDQNGNVFVASSGSAGGVAKVQEYSANGAYLRTVATVAGGRAEGVAFDSATNILYASFEGSGAATGFIEKYTFNGTTFTDAGALASGLNSPAYLAVVPVVPEPSAIVLAVLGILGIGMCVMQRKCGTV